jgi:xanthine dehydrogenase accessory factor
MRETLERMLDLEREGRRFVAATVVRTQGSTPQVVGARLLVDDRDRISGTLGGGCVEGDAISEARRVLDTGDSSLRAYALTEPLAWDTGLVCGGTMWIHIEPDTAVLGGDWAARLRESLGEAESREPLAFGTRLRVQGRTIAAEGHCLIERPAVSVGLSDRARQVVSEAFARGVARLVPMDDGHELLIEPIVAEPRLVIAGGGHVAHALSQMGQLVGYDVTVIDDR